MPDGWTVASVLAHAGYRDARAIYWLDTWDRGVEPAPWEPENVEAVNESTKPLCLALPPRVAADLALKLANRREHLDDIESAFPRFGKGRA